MIGILIGFHAMNQKALERERSDNDRIHEE